MAGEKTQIIGISGKQMVGKDHVALYLSQALQPQVFRIIPLALAIKQVYAKQTQVTLEEIEANKAFHRAGLIALGDWGREQDPEYWLKQVLKEPGPKLIPDVRLKKEYDLLKSHGAFLIRVVADRPLRQGRGQLVSEDDPTECELDDIPQSDWDAYIENNGTLEALEAQVKLLAAKIP
ncbi:MAG: hypothetical protein K2X66_10775 [Cyanobacteria bacterium]|nr:hypothetical protein [Cyanobacteriota bacterium]